MRPKLGLFWVRRLSSREKDVEVMIHRRRGGFIEVYQDAGFTLYGGGHIRYGMQAQKFSEGGIDKKKSTNSTKSIPRALSNEIQSAHSGGKSYERDRKGGGRADLLKISAGIKFHHGRACDMYALNRPYQTSTSKKEKGGAECPFPPKPHCWSTPFSLIS